MKIFDFIKAMVPRIEKDQILEDLRVTIGELEQVVAPSFLHAADYFRSNQFLSDKNKDLSDAFYRKFDKGSMAKQSSFIGEIAVRIPFIKDNLQFVQSQIEEILERDVISEGLTAKKAILIRTANHLSFISRFSTDLLNVVYVNEAVTADTKVKESLQVAPAIFKHIDRNLSSFAAYLSDYGIPNKDFVKLFENIPDIVVASRNEHAISGMYKEKDIDPFTSPYVQGFAGNPIYHVRLIFAEWQASRYKANKEMKKMLELRLLHLKLVQDKKSDPKLETEINYIQGRVDKIERYMREIEESVEVTN